MSLKNKTICRKCSNVFIFMLLFQVSFSQKNWNEVDKWMQNNLQQMGSRAVLMIYKDGKIVYNHAENNIGQRQKMVAKFIAKKTGKDANELTADLDANSRLSIASCSKWLSAALVMSFVDEGKLNLEDSIGKYLPVMTQHGKGAIKIRYCLSHLTGIKQSGIMADVLGKTEENEAENTDAQTTPNQGRARLRDRFAQMKNQGGGKLNAANKWPSMDAAMDSIAAMPMDGEPGKTFHYGNVGLQICAAIIEKISGKDFETLFQERIAKPCQMNNSDFGKKAVPLAAGSAISTCQDYMNFLEMILAKGKFNGKKVLSEKAVTEMQIDRTINATMAYSPAKDVGWNYGYGEWISEEKNNKTNVVSSPGLFGSFPWVNIENGYCGFLFCFNLKYQGRHEMYQSLADLVKRQLQ